MQRMIGKHIAVALLAVVPATQASWGELIGNSLLEGAANAVGSAIGEAVSNGDAQDRASGGRSVNSVAGRSYAASAQSAGMSLAQIAALPQTLSPMPVQMKAGDPDVFRAKPRIAIPRYGIAFLRSGDVSAHAAGRGSSLVQRSVRIKVALAGFDDADFRQLSDEAYADLLERLKAAGIGTVGHDALSAQAGYAAVERVRGNSFTESGHITGRHEQTWTTYGASAGPLVKGMAMETGMGRVAGAGATLRLVDVAYDVDALVVQPMLVLDFVQMESSGSSMLTSRANADARLMFSIHPMSKVDVNYARKKGRGNIWGPLTLAQGSYTDEPFAVLRKVDENTSDQSIYQAFSAIGMGNMFKKSEGYAAQFAKGRYKALVRAAYSGYNAAIVEQIKQARDTTVAARSAAEPGGDGGGHQASCLICSGRPAPWLAYAGTRALAPLPIEQK